MSCPRIGLVRDKIEKALKHNNNYKLVFVAMLDSGRIRAADLVTINTVCDAVKTNFEYGIVFNQVMPKVVREINQQGLTHENMLAYLSMLDLHKKPSQVAILVRDGEIEGEMNMYFEGRDNKNRKELLSFIDKLNANRIEENKVKKLEVIDYAEKLNEMEEKYKRAIAEMEGTIREQQEEIGTLRNKGCVLF